MAYVIVVLHGHLLSLLSHNTVVFILVIKLSRSLNHSRLSLFVCTYWCPLLSLNRINSINSARRSNIRLGLGLQKYLRWSLSIFLWSFFRRIWVSLVCLFLGCVVLIRVVSLTIWNLKLPFEGTIKSILYMIISSTWKKFGDFTPLVTILFMSLNYLLIFLNSPFVFLDIRIQMIVPSFTTLFTDSSR